MSNDPRRFTDEQFALALRKAMTLQDNPGPDGKSLPAGGMTLDEMKAVAREVGIDPALMEQAVALLPSQERSPADRILGGPTRYRLEHSATQRLSREDLARVVDAVRREMQQPGKVSTELDGLSWETEGEVSQFHVSLSPRESGTEVRLNVNRDGAFILTWFLSVLGGLVAAGITGGIVDPDTIIGGAGLVATGLGGGLAVARTLWGKTTRSVQDKIDRVMEAVVREVDRTRDDDES